MQFTIEVLTVTKSTATNKKGTPYTVYEVAYKRDGKVEGKKLFEFAAKDVCKALANASTGDKFDIVAEKEGDFWQWKQAAPSGSGTVSSQSASSASSGNSTSASKSPMKGEWETREERQLRQLYIIKQSSLSNAISTLKTEKSYGDPESILALAQKYTNWVMDSGIAQEVQQKASVDSMEDDLPWETK